MPDTTDRDPLADALRSAFQEGPHEGSRAGLHARSQEGAGEGMSATSSCLHLGRLAEIGSGETPSEMEGSHVTDCAVCTAEIALARAFYQDEAADGNRSEEIGRIVEALEREYSPQRFATSTGKALSFPSATDHQGSASDDKPPRPIGLRRGLYRWAAAAVLLMAAGLITWRVSPRPPVLPPPPDVDITRGGEIGILPIASDPRGWSTLDWDPVVGADYYLVDVQRIDGESLWSERADDDAATLPPKVEVDISPGVRWRWRVRGFDANGVEIASSVWTDRLRPLDPG